MKATLVTGEWAVLVGGTVARVFDLQADAERYARGRRLFNADGATVEVVYWS